MRNTMMHLMRMQCDGNVLFRCASRMGMSVDLIELASSGRVDPEVIEERGSDSPARPAWLGLAALAAFAREDRFATLRYLREASRDDEMCLSWAAIHEIRERADASLNEDLDKLLVPSL